MLIVLLDSGTPLSAVKKIHVHTHTHTPVREIHISKKSCLDTNEQVSNCNS